MLANLEVPLEERAAAGIIDKFVQALNLDCVTNGPSDNRADRNMVAVDPFHRAAQKILPPSFLRKSTDFVGKLFGEITHIQITNAVK